MIKQLFGLLATLIIAALVALDASPAYACSADPSFNPIEHSEIIVAGRIESWRPLPTTGNDTFTPVQITMDVDESLKGNISGQLQFVDRASLIASDPTNTTWAGGSGACGVFDAEPTGMYVILGLTHGTDGAYQSNRMQVFFIGDEPSGEGYEQAIARLTDANSATPGNPNSTSPRGPVALPDTGISQLSFVFPLSFAALMLIMIGIALKRMSEREAET